MWSLAAALALLILIGCKPAEQLDARYRTVPNADLQRGRNLMSQYQCGSCHALPDVPAAAVTAVPTLAGFGRRSYIAGRLANGPVTLQQWLMNPPAAVPGATMPNLGVSAIDARDIAGYLLSLE